MVPGSAKAIVVMLVFPFCLLLDALGVVRGGKGEVGRVGGPISLASGTTESRMTIGVRADAFLSCG